MWRTVLDEMLDFEASLNRKVDSMTLDAKLKEIYEQGQNESIRSGIHLSDLKRADTYKGQPNFCFRQLVLAAFFNPTPVRHEHPTIAYFEQGIDFHRRWQEKFWRAGVIVSIQDALGLEAEHELSPQVNGVTANWKLLFTPDIIINIGQGLEIVELKGYNDQTYKTLVRTPNILPHDAHVQANMYAHFTGIHKFIILVENKNDQRFHAWRGEYDPELVKPYEARMGQLDQLVNEYATSGKLPRRICTDATCKRATECGMSHACFATAQGRAQWKK